MCFLCICVVHYGTTKSIKANISSRNPKAQVFDTILQAGCMALDEIADEKVTFPLPLRFVLKK